MSRHGPRKCARDGCGNPIRQSRGVGRKRHTCSATCRSALRRERDRDARRKGLVMHSADSVEWYTPPDLFAELAARYGPFDLDPCADPRSPIWPLVPNHWTAEDDGLVQPWFGRVWMNPPYGEDCPPWLERAGREVALGNVELVCALVKAATGPAWWWNAIEAGAKPEFLRGRVQFFRPDGSHGPAPFDSAVLLFRAAPAAQFGAGGVP